METIDRELSKKKFTTECTAAYLATLRGFIAENVAQKLGEQRKSRGMFEALEREDEWDEDTDLSMGASGLVLFLFTHKLVFADLCLIDADKAIVDNKVKVTDQQLKTFLDICWKKYVKAKIEPGTSPISNILPAITDREKALPSVLLVLSRSENQERR